MIVIKQGKGPNPLIGFRVEEAVVTPVGQDLRRPECILAERNGSLWAADARGGVMHIASDGSQRLITQAPDPHFDVSRDAAASLLEGTLPNGLAFAGNGDILISNFGTDRLEVMTRDGATRVLLDRVDGRPPGKINFVLRDRRDRIWITVSTQVNPWSDAIRRDLADGCIILLDGKGARIVADGFHFTNEIRLDEREEWLYVAETTAKRVSRLRVQPDGALTDREIYGPASLGDGMIDGIAFDAYGNLWATMIFADRLIAITPDGQMLELFADGDPEAVRALETAFTGGGPVPFDLLMKARGRLCPWLASVTFGGPDLRTVHLGSLLGTSIPTFRSPVPGLPMVHW